MECFEASFDSSIGICLASHGLAPGSSKTSKDEWRWDTNLWHPHLVPFTLTTNQTPNIIEWATG